MFSRADRGIKLNSFFTSYELKELCLASSGANVLISHKVSISIQDPIGYGHRLEIVKQDCL